MTEQFAENAKNSAPERSDELMERAAVVAWLDHWVMQRDGSDYTAGWSMAMSNAAREIERGDHLLFKETPA